MRQFLSFVLAVATALSPAFASSNSANHHQTPTPAPSAPAASPERSFEQTGPATGFETLRGEAAMNHIANWKAKRPGEFRRATEQMIARGYRPTQIAVVVRSLHLTSDGWVPAKNLGPYRRAQTTVQAAEGEVIFWSWDDGDPTTWEGTIHCENYTSGVTVDLDDQADITTDNPFVISEITTFEERHDPYEIRLPRHESRGEIYPVLDRANKRFLGCIIGGLVGSAMGCAITGAAWLPCFVAGATATVIGCLIQRII